MIRVILSLFIASTIFLGGCKDKDPFGISFDLNYTASTTVESGSLLDIPFDFFTPDITTDSEAQFEANDTRKDKVQEIKLKELMLKITQPNGKTFSFLKHIYFFISADGQNEQRFAFKENINSNTSNLSLEVDDVDLSSYIKSDKFKLRVQTVTRETLNQDVDIQADMVFRVKAEVL